MSSWLIPQRLYRTHPLKLNNIRLHIAANYILNIKFILPLKNVSTLSWIINLLMPNVWTNIVSVTCTNCHKSIVVIAQNIYCFYYFWIREAFWNLGHQDFPLSRINIVEKTMVQAMPAVPANSWMAPSKNTLMYKSFFQLLTLRKVSDNSISSCSNVFLFFLTFKLPYQKTAWRTTTTKQQKTPWG